MGEPAQQPIHVSPFGPVVGASPEDTIRGFLSAGYGFDDDHAIARSFLTQAASDEWKPDTGVTVHDNADASVKVTLSGRTVQVSTSPVAVLDGNGYYHEVAKGTPARASFGLARVGGQWRISSVPKGFGLWLSQYDMDRIYRPFSINYVDPVQRTLVADRRWFPVTAGLATTLARAQLDPVPDYLQGAVTTGVPLGTALTVAAVPVQSGRATVDLTVARPLGGRRSAPGDLGAVPRHPAAGAAAARAGDLAAGGRRPARPAGAGGVPVLAGRPRVPPGRHDGADGGRAAHRQHPDARRPRPDRQRGTAAQGPRRQLVLVAQDPAGVDRAGAVPRRQGAGGGRWRPAGPVPVEGHGEPPAAAPSGPS